MEVTNEREESIGKENRSEVVSGIRDKICLKDLGIISLRPKRAATGALIYEVSGLDSAAETDKLAECLKSALDGKGVTVTRPVKTEDLRITGLDDTVTPEEVAKAVAEQGGCSVGLVKVGEVRQTTSGLGSVWVQCPSAAAMKAAEAGRLIVGWVSAKVEALQPRGLHCFRCLEKGHTKAQCNTTKDRSGRCYRCGQPGQTAAGCTVTLSCLLCSDLGRPTEHRLGAPSCAPAPKKGRNSKSGGSAAGGNSRPVSEEGAKTPVNKKGNGKGKGKGKPQTRCGATREEGLEKETMAIK
jgi:hypothetical protein